MKKGLLFVAMSMVFTLPAFAGALRVSDGRGETSDYAVTAASLRNGTVTLEARRFQISSSGDLAETERKYFNVSSEVLKSSGIDAGSLISIVLNKNIRGDLFCSVGRIALDCSSLVVSASTKE